MAVHACMRGVAEVSVHTLVGGVTGYGFVALASTINPVVGATFGIVDTLISSVVSKVFAFVEREARNHNSPQIANFIHKAGEWEMLTTFLVVGEICLGALFSMEIMGLLLLAKLASLLFSSLIIAAISP